MINVFTKISQFISWFFFKPLFSSLFKIHYTGRENIISLRGPLLIISNHIAFYDSFLFRIMPGLFSRLLPFRFMGVMKFRNPLLNFFVYTGIIPIIYAIFGVFVVVKGRGIEEGIKEAREIINNKGVVVMFPEGFTTEGVRIEEFKKGAAALALATQVPVIPVALRKDGGNVYINIGKFIQLDPAYDWDSATILFHNKVSRLFAETFPTNPQHKEILSPVQIEDLEAKPQNKNISSDFSK